MTIKNKFNRVKKKFTKIRTKLEKTIDHKLGLNDEIENQ